MMRKVMLLIFSAGALLALGGCTDTQSTKVGVTDPTTSSIPWNKPEKWETGSNVPGAEYINSQ